MSKHNGITELDIDGTVYKLFYGYSQMSEVVEKFGEDALLTVPRSNPRAIVGMALIGLAKYHPDITAQMLEELNAPLIDLITAVDRALASAYLGPKKIEEIEKMVEQNAAAKKKANA